MKANLTTRIEHTINFYSLEAFAIRGYYGLKDLFLEQFKDKVSYTDISIANVGPKSLLKYKDVCQERLDEDSLKVFESEDVDATYIRVILMSLVNREILPPGDYCVTFVQD